MWNESSSATLANLVNITATIPEIPCPVDNVCMHNCTYKFLYTVHELFVLPFAMF